MGCCVHSLVNIRSPPRDPADPHPPPATPYVAVHTTSQLGSQVTYCMASTPPRLSSTSACGASTPPRVAPDSGCCVPTPPRVAPDSGCCVSTPPRITSSAASTPTYGSFAFPPTRLDLDQSERTKRDADLAQREADLALQEAALDTRMPKRCSLSLMRPCWHDAPFEWQWLMLQLWRFWLSTIISMLWNLGCATLMLIEDGRDTGDSDRTAVEAGQQFGLAFAFALLAPSFAFNVWLLPSLSATHGTSSRFGGCLAFAALMLHTSLSGVAAVCPPGYGIVGVTAVRQSFSEGHRDLVALSTLNTAGFALTSAYGVFVCKLVHDSRVFYMPALNHQLAASAEPDRLVAYGKI